MEKLSFHFSNTGWQLISTGETAGWLEELGRIMAVSECKGDHKYKIIIFRDDKKTQKIDEIICRCREAGHNLPAKNWRVHKIYSSYFLTHPESSLSIFHHGYRTGEVIEYSKMMFILIPVYEHIIYTGGLPIHGALIEKDSDGFILSGPSGAGKSTLCERIADSFHVLCDDLSLIVKDNHYGYSAHPLPTWSRFREGKSGFSWETQKKIVLKKLFFLEKSDRDEIIPLKIRDAAMKIFYLSFQVCFNREGMEKEEIMEKKRNIFGRSWEIASSIPCYILRNKLTGSGEQKNVDVICSLL